MSLYGMGRYSPPHFTEFVHPTHFLISQREIEHNSAKQIDIIKATRLLVALKSEVQRLEELLINEQDKS